MSKCKYEMSNGRCGLKGCYAYRHNCFTEDLCKCYDPQTNGDRIRAMSDEELAEWLVIQTVYQESAFSPPSYRNFLSDLDDTKENAIKDTKEWLKQPAEEEE